MGYVNRGGLVFAAQEADEAEIERLAQALDAADAVLVGAGAGLSTAAGLTYSGERFERDFSLWRERYGFTDAYSGGFYAYDRLEDFWGFWCRNILVNRYEYGRLAVYEQLAALLRGRDYFVLTTNVDHCFQRAGIAKDRLFYTQGDYGLFQCSRPCCDKTCDNEEQVRAMCAALDEKIAQQRAAGIPARIMDLSIPSGLVPHCPVCGAPMTTNLRRDDTFAEDDGWRAAARRYHDFQRRHEDADVLLLELGVGANTPGIIKYPFWRMTAHNKQAVYACVNAGEACAPANIEEQSILVNADIADVLGRLSR